MTITNLFGEKVPRVAALPWSPGEVEARLQIRPISQLLEQTVRRLANSRQYRTCLPNQKEIDVYSKMVFTSYQRGMSEEGFNDYENMTVAELKIYYEMQVYCVW